MARSFRYDGDTPKNVKVLHDACVECENAPAVIFYYKDEGYCFRCDLTLTRFEQVYALAAA